MENKEFAVRDTYESLDDVGKDSLRKYSNASKHDGMMKIWGDHMKEFRNFCDNLRMTD